MTQKLGIGKVLAIPALSASYGKLPNALARARNEKVACSSQVTSSIKNHHFTVKSGGLSYFLNDFTRAVFAKFCQCLLFDHYLKNFSCPCWMRSVVWLGRVFVPLLALLYRRIKQSNLQAGGRTNSQHHVLWVSYAGYRNGHRPFEKVTKR